MKIKSPEFVSQCRVLSFPWMQKRSKRTCKLDNKMTQEQAERSQVFMFEPPSVEFTSGTEDPAFPLIQMMNGKEPVVWEDSSKQTHMPVRGESESVSSVFPSSKTSSIHKSVSKSRIPRPRNAFILYRSHVSQLLKEAMAFKVRESNISSLVSEMWKKESDVVHAYYAKRAALEWVKYMKRVQQERCTLNSDESRAKSPTPPVSFQNELPSLSPESQSKFVSNSMTTSAQPSFSSSIQTSTKNSMMTSYEDPFVGTMLYNSSPDTSNLGLNDTVTCLSSSPRSSNEDFFDPAYVGNTGQTGIMPGYSLADKTSMPFYSFKDSMFSLPYDMNQFDINYGYSLNPSTTLFSTNTYPYVVGTGLGIDTGLRWPGLMTSSNAAWPVNIV